MCDSCEALMINGIYCHETGCPDAWKDYKRECKWCGQEFMPDEEHHEFCSVGCVHDYNS